MSKGFCLIAQNNDTTGPGGYRLLYFNMGFKTGKSFKPEKIL